MPIRRVFSLFAVLIFIFGVAGAIILYSRGYRINLAEKSFSSTGILSVSSSPDKASIFINDKLVSATNASLSLVPGWYQVRVNLEGYQAWEKRVRVQGEIVSQADALLIPANPSLRAITVSGTKLVTLSPSRSKVAYIVSPDDQTASSSIKPKAGVWILDLRTGLLGTRVVPKQLLSSKIPLNTASITWSPDEKELLVLISKPAVSPATGQVPEKTGKVSITQALLFEVDSAETAPTDVSDSYNNLLAVWKEDEKSKQDTLLETLPASLSAVLSASSTNIIYSPDETKILYLATAAASLSPLISPPIIGSNPTEEQRSVTNGNYYVYDTKEDKNFLLTDQKTHGNVDSLIWYSDSKHIAEIENNTIYMTDYDGTNKRTVYSGPFEDNILFSWPSGGKLIIATNLNKPQALPNLYEIDLR